MVIQFFCFCWWWSLNAKTNEYEGNGFLIIKKHIRDYPGRNWYSMPRLHNWRLMCAPFVQQSWEQSGLHSTGVLQSCLIHKWCVSISMCHKQGKADILRNSSFNLCNSPSWYSSKVRRASGGRNLPSPPSMGYGRGRGMWICVVTNLLQLWKRDEVLEALDEISRNRADII